MIGLGRPGDLVGRTWRWGAPGGPDRVRVDGSAGHDPGIRHRAARTAAVPGRGRRRPGGGPRADPVSR
ncbi:hypothetical protein GCM10009736_64810 [Actinomadura bangladeshensis]